MNIPRYKAQMPMQKTFVRNCDGCGDHIFTQIERSGKVALYRRDSAQTGSCKGYEVIVIKTTPAGTIFAKGSKPTEKDAEGYPGAESFGRLAWHFVNEQRAFERFDTLVLSELNK